MATNPVSFYYRKDLNVTKHGEFKMPEGAATIPFGTAVYRDDATKEIRVATTSAEFEGIVDKIILTSQGNDDLTVKAGERARVGVGVDYEFVAKGAVAITGAVGDEVAVGAGGAFVAPVAGTNEAVGRIVERFPNGETVVRIY